MHEVVADLVAEIMKLEGVDTALLQKQTSIGKAYVSRNLHDGGNTTVIVSIWPEPFQLHRIHYGLYQLKPEYWDSYTLNHFVWDNADQIFDTIHEKSWL